MSPKNTSALERFEKFVNNKVMSDVSQPPILCSKLTIETLEEGLKYVQI